MLAHKLAAATQNERYKPSDRSNLVLPFQQHLWSQRQGRVSFSKNCHPSFSASLNVKGSSLLLSPLSKGEPEGQIPAAFPTSPLRGRRKENNPVNCFLTTGAELLICDPAAATEANVTVAADRSKLVLPFQQHLVTNKLSSLVQRQSERQGIFKFVTLS